MLNAIMGETPPNPLSPEVNIHTPTKGTSSSYILNNENLIDTLFYSCDVNHSGLVQVSGIVSFLRGITDPSGDNYERMELLSSMLDPDGCDPKIDIDTYRRGTEAWIQHLNTSGFNDSCSELNDSTDVYSNSVSSSPAPKLPTAKHFLQLSIIGDGQNMISPLKPNLIKNSDQSPGCSLATTDGCTSDGDGSCDLWQHIADLEFRNRFLCDEVNSLKEQLEQNEEIAAGLSKEVERLKSEAKSQHAVKECLVNLRKENEELKASIAAVVAAKSHTEEELAASQHDCNLLEKEKQQIWSELSKLQEELSKLEKEKELLCCQLFEEKQANQETTKEIQEEKAKLALKNVEVEELHSLLSEMDDLNKNLRKEKNDLEQHLAETMREMTSVSKYAALLCQIHDMYDIRNKQCTELQRALEANCKSLSTELVMVNRAKLCKKHGDSKKDSALSEFQDRTLDTELNGEENYCPDSMLARQFERGSEEQEEKSEILEDLDKNKEELEHKLEAEKERLLFLQDSLSMYQNEQHMDLKDLWRLVHTNVEAECLTESQGTSISISADSLREKVAKEILSLKSQLERSQAALQALQDQALPSSFSTGSRRYESNPNNSLVEALSLGDLCESSVIIPSKLDSTSCPHLDRKHTTCSTQTELKNTTPGPVPKRRAPHVKNNKYTALNSSTGSSTSGVDVSSVSSRSDSHGCYPQHKSVCIIETPIDCPSSPDEFENPLTRHRSQSFMRAIERGASGDSSVQSYDTGEPSSTSPDLSPEHTYPPNCPVPLGKDHHQNSSDHPSGQHLNPPQQYWRKDHNVFFDSARSQKCRSKPEINSKPADTNPDMETKNNEPNSDNSGSPKGRRLSTLVEESDQEGEDFHAGLHLRSPRTPLSPLYFKRAGHSLPQYKEPPSYKAIIQSRSRDTSPSLVNRAGSNHQRSRSLSPHHHEKRMSPTYHSHASVLGYSSLPASPQVSGMSGSHKAKMEFRGTDSSGSVNKCTLEKADSNKSNHSGESTTSARANQCFSNDERSNAHSPQPYQSSSVLKARRKSLQDMRQSSSNLLLNINQETDVPTAGMELSDGLDREEDVTVALNDSIQHELISSQDEDARGKMADSVVRDRKTSPAHCESPLDRSTNVTRDMECTSRHSKHSGQTENVSVTGGNSAQTDAQGIICSSSESLPKHTICPEEPCSPSGVYVGHLTSIPEDNLNKRQNLTKQSTMPELSEGVAAEEGKQDSTQPDEVTESGEPKAAFPSLSDVFLEQMKLLPGKKDKLKSLDQTPEQEIEEKFIRLSLAFKTDRMTLDKRIELHQRARDVAEKNIEQELNGIKEALKILGPLCRDAKSREVFSKIEHHVDVLENSTARMSSRAEVLGAVKQEGRISEAIEVMIQHVENLKRSYSRQSAELDEAKRLLMENRGLGPGAETDVLLHKRSMSISGNTPKDLNDNQNTSSTSSQSHLVSEPPVCLYCSTAVIQTRHLTDIELELCPDKCTLFGKLTYTEVCWAVLVILWMLVFVVGSLFVLWPFVELEYAGMPVI